MSTATAAADTPVAPKSGKKKLIIIIAAALLFVVVAGAGALFFLKKKAAAAEEDADGSGHEVAAQHEPKAPPTFVLLDPFTINLADRDIERYAQIGVTLGVEDSKVADAIKMFMPAIRSNLLMLMAQKTATELMTAEGKQQLAQEILRETARGLGYPAEDETDAEDDAEDDPKPARKKKKKKAAPPLPVQNVYFSTFIVQ